MLGGATLESIRVPLPSGGWWAFKPELTHGDQRRIDRHTQSAALRLVGELEQSGLDLNKLTSSKTPDTNPAVMGPDQEDIMLLVGSETWSFPGGITEETIEARNGRDTAAVLRRMKQVYYPPEDTEDDQEGKGD